MDPHKAGQEAADKALQSLGYPTPTSSISASEDASKINDTGVRLCYECLTYDDDIPGEAVAQGLCRRHLAMEYADEAMWDEQ